MQSNANAVQINDQTFEQLLCTKSGQSIRFIYFKSSERQCYQRDCCLKNVIPSDFRWESSGEDHWPFQVIQRHTFGRNQVGVGFHLIVRALVHLPGEQVNAVGQRTDTGQTALCAPLVGPHKASDQWTQSSNQCRLIEAVAHRYPSRCLFAQTFRFDYYCLNLILWTDNPNDYHLLLHYDKLATNLTLVPTQCPVSRRRHRRSPESEPTHFQNHCRRIH